MEVDSMVEASCMKCKKQIEVKDSQDVLMKNGIKAVSGFRPHCSTKFFKIIGKK
jgi:endogenous inhibitor of DNA gyrase (YacG/DUF329 family)